MKKLMILLFPLFSSQTLAASSTERLGNIATVGMPAFAAAISYVNNDIEGLWQLGKSEAAALGIVEVLKSTVHETRPDGSDRKSFPSRHSAVAFSAAHYLQTGGGWMYGIPAYALATYVGYSRVNANKHYWRDVIAGGATGVLTTAYFTKEEEKQGVNLSFHERGLFIEWHQRMP